ncbi:MAG: hypothetical protein H7138_04310 [Myxococcales bacterium]|nr:hypothetical protein [Myxococcales bacterium]
MLQKKTFKVLAAIAKRDGSHWWMKCGSAHTNKDDSINVYLDAVPRDLKFQLRELDEEDLRRREAYRAGTSAGTGTGEAGPPGDGYVARSTDAGSPAANTAAPF